MSDDSGKGIATLARAELVASISHFRPLDGCAERIVYRQLFLSGLTAFDPLELATLGTRPGRSHFAAQQEVRDLYALLQLPPNDRTRRRAIARAEWFASAALPLEASDLVAD